MNTALELTPFQIRVSAIEEGTSNILRLPAFPTSGVSALARVDRAAGTAELVWIPLLDGLRLGLPEPGHQRLRGRLYELAARKLGRLLLGTAPAPGEVPVVDLTLPCLDKRMAANRAEIWNEPQPAAELGGFAQTIVSGWLATVRQERELPPIEWTHRAAMTGATARAILQPLLSWYRGGEEDLPAWDLSSEYEIDFSVSLDGAAAAGWYELGPERTYDFFRSLVRVSCAAQAAVRRWLPALWLTDARMFDHPREAVALLAYASLPPLLARSRRNYTYDPVDAASLKQALSQCARKIQRQLQIWYPTLVAQGHEAAEELHPRWHSRWSADLTRRGKRVQALLANEAWLIDQLVNFAAEFQPHVRLSELSGPIRRARAIHAALDARFRRWWDGRSAQPLIGLLLLEATSALSAAPVHLTVSLRKRDGSGEISAPIVLRASRAAAAEEEAPRSSEAA
jgi:hypothetical protein